MYAQNKEITGSYSVKMVKCGWLQSVGQITRVWT